jgi:hypothetical protein
MLPTIGFLFAQCHSMEAVMGDLALDIRVPYAERVTVAVILPRLLCIGHVGLISGFGIVIMGMLVLIHQTNRRANPFMTYSDIFPGNAHVALSAHGFTCWLQDYNYNDSSETRCRLNLKTGAFSHIEAVHAKGVIRQISFEVRDNALNVGELMTILELAEIRFRGVVLFTWRGKLGLARIGNPANHFSLFRDVWVVTLTDMPWSTALPDDHRLFVYSLR